MRHEHLLGLPMAWMNQPGYAWVLCGWFCVHTRRVWWIGMDTLGPEEKCSTKGKEMPTTTKEAKSVATCTLLAERIATLGGMKTTPACLNGDGHSCVLLIAWMIVCRCLLQANGGNADEK